MLFMRTVFHVTRWKIWIKVPIKIPDRLNFDSLKKISCNLVTINFWKLRHLWLFKTFRVVKLNEASGIRHWLQSLLTVHFSQCHLHRPHFLKAIHQYNSASERRRHISWIFHCSWYWTFKDGGHDVVVTGEQYDVWNPHKIIPMFPSPFAKDRSVVLFVWQACNLSDVCCYFSYPDRVI